MIKFLTLEVVQILLFALFILFGAMANVGNQFLISRKRGEETDGVTMLVSFLLATFSGTMVGLFSTQYVNNVTFQFISAGMGAFLGIQLISMIGNFGMNVVSTYLQNKYGNLKDNHEDIK